MYGFFRTLHDMFRSCCTFTLSSTLCHVLSIYVASEMTNSNCSQKSNILANFDFFGFFWGFFEKIWISCSLHGGTYKVQKSDLDDSVEGTKKAM
jgi:hypothetical protein